MRKYEVEKTKEGHAYLEQLTGEDKHLACEVMDYVEEAKLMPEQTIIIELTLLKKFVDEKAVGRDVASMVADPESFARAAISEIGESVRQDRHLATLMSGLALCALVLLVRSGYDLIAALSSGMAFMSAQTSLDAGHMLALVCILVASRFFVVGDKKEDYSDAKKANRRSWMVVIFVMLALLLIALPVFDSYVIVTLASVYIVLFSLVLLVVGRLGSRL